MAKVSPELLASSISANRTAITDELSFTVDFYRCGKCDKEYELLEDFIFHKIVFEKNSMVLWDSEKISGIQIPRFTENGMNIYVTQETNLNAADGNLKHKNFTYTNTNELEKSKFSLESQNSFVNLQNQESSQMLEYNHKKRKNRDEILSPSKRSCPVTQTKAHESAKVRLFHLNPRKKPQKPECDICGNTYRDLTTLKTHIATVHSNSRPYQCKYNSCPCSFKTKASLQRHIRRHTGERPFSCPDCGRMFRESGTLARHMKARVPCVKKEDTDLPRYGKNASFPKHNMEEFEDLSEDEEEQNEHTSPPETIQIVITHMPEEATKFNVTSNPQVTANEGSIIGLTGDVSIHPDFAQLLEVATRVREDPEPGSSLESATVIPPDPEQSTISVDSQEMKKIITMQLLEQNFQCVGCDEQIRQPLLFSQHLQSHIEDFKFRCTKCYFVSKDKNNLVHHTRNVHNKYLNLPLNSLSEIDDNKWAQEIVMQLLVLHDVIDEQEQCDTSTASKRNAGSNRCHVCLKKFQGKSYFGLHMGTHTGEKPHECNICSRTFICKDFLQKHLVSHSSERSFKCAVCSKLFKRASHIREHLRIHSENKLYFCKICERGFKWQGALKSHELTHSRDAQFTCETCGRRFRARSSLIRHTKRHVSNRPTEQQTIGSVNVTNVASCEGEEVSTLQLPAAPTDDAQGDQQTYLLILEDGSLMIQSGLQDGPNMW